MGLTIHYQFRSGAKSPTEAQRLIERLRQRALDLPFQEVGPIVNLCGDACDFRRALREDPNRWMLIQARQTVIRGHCHYDVVPQQVIAFTTLPGEGCEPANFGLCLYPWSIEITELDSSSPRAWRLRTNLRGWSWRSFCKTQYASNPRCGGTVNFLRCHLLVTHMLDCARELGMLGDVSDEGGFWEKREVPALAQEVGEWNQMIAAQVGQLKDRFGQTFSAPIQSFPDFGHLEAAGTRY
jgi:hypothetical protein